MTRRKFRLPVLTVRLRLALLLGAGLVAGGILLLAITFFVVGHVLPQWPHHQPGGPLGYSRYLHRLMLTRSLTPKQLDALRHAIPPALQPALRSQRQDFATRLLAGSGIALLVLAFLAGFVAWAASGRILHPLKQMADTARRLSGHNLGERIALSGPKDELRELADTFDDMLDRLGASFEAQRQFVANASHELRTPLAVQRTLLEVALADPHASPEDLRRATAGALRVNERSQRLIDGLLLLARSSRLRTDVVPIDLAGAAREALAGISHEIRAKSLRVDAALDPAPVKGDPDLIWRMIGNIVENAVRHNVRGGLVRITTRSTPQGAEFQVENSGDVIPDAQVPALFEPFRRPHDRTRSDRGSGLGLSIVRSVAEAHGGTVSFTPRAEGGALVQVVLPQGRSAPAAI